MDIIAGLQNKKNAEAYQLLLLLEKQSEETNELYACFEDFIGLLGSKNSYVRVRGFRLACAQAKWDAEDQIGKNLDVLLGSLAAAKPTELRQCLAALRPVVRYKPGLTGRIGARLRELDLAKYSDSMRPLIEKDLEAFKSAMTGPIEKS